MADFKETCVEYIDAEPHATFCSAERKWITKILKLKEVHPNEVDIRKYPTSNDGIILAHLPKSWLKISPPKTRNMTDEQREAAAKRMANIRSKR